MRRALALFLTALGVSAAMGAAPVAGAATPRPQPRRAAEPAPAGDAVVAWNQFLLDLQAAPGVQPATVHPTYELALMHAAIYDAVVSIDRSGAPYLTDVHGARRASAPAAADAAAHGTLAALYPAERAAVDARYAAMLAQLPGGRHTAMGARVGERLARQLLARRAGDGSAAAPRPFVPGHAPGEYQLTPPAFAPPAFTQWRHVEPFVIGRSSRFRPPAPPKLTSARYAAAIDEVKALGAAEGSVRTADETQIGLFWNAPIWATWNRIAQTAALAHPGGLAKTARTFAALDLTFADSVIAFYDAKYTYRFWRPVTAIRAADADGNPATTADPAWTPLSPTAPDPSYPGAHGTISAAGASVLAAMYGDRLPLTVTSPALPGVTRTFAAFSAAAREASESRILNGNHTRLDEDAGEALGHDVARYVLLRAVRPLPRAAHGR